MEKTKNFQINKLQQLIARKDLISGLEQKKIVEEAKLTKEISYQNRYNTLSSSADIAGKTGIAFMVTNLAIGTLTASGVGIPVAGGIAVCLILVHKLMNKYKQLKDLEILLLDINTILTNCYYLENMIIKVLTIFQIYINDYTEGKIYYSQIITVDEEYNNLHNTQSCKNIAILVKENQKAEKEKAENKVDDDSSVVDMNDINVQIPEKTNFLNKTKVLKGYNLGERIQNAKQLFIKSNDINAVIEAEQNEYILFEKIIDIKNHNNYINIDDDDALESLLKFMIYKRIKYGLESCSKSQEPNEGFYDTDSKNIYKIGVNSDIKYRIKQKLDIIRDLLIEIDPIIAQESIQSVELNESLDKIEKKAFDNLKNKKLYSDLITYSYSSFEHSYSSFETYSIINNILHDKKPPYCFKLIETIDTEYKLDNYLKEFKITENNEKNEKLLNIILSYWFKIKQQITPNQKQDEKNIYNQPEQEIAQNKICEQTEQEKKLMNSYLKLHKEEFTNYLKKCFLKIEFHNSGKKVKDPSNDNIDKPYSNYEDWVRAFLITQNKIQNTNQNLFFKFGNKITTSMKNTMNYGKIFLTADIKTKQLMNTLNTLNALFIIINSQFEMTLKYYERALKFDYVKIKKASNDFLVTDVLNLFGFSSEKETKKKHGVDRIWELCESTVAYQKFLLPPDFNEDKKAIMNNVEVDDINSLFSSIVTSAKAIVTDF